MSNREYLWNKEKWFLFHFESSFCSHWNTVIKLEILRYSYVMTSLNTKHETWNHTFQPVNFKIRDNGRPGLVTKILKNQTSRLLGGKKHWLKGCLCGEKFIWLAGKFSGNFSGDFQIAGKCTSDYKINVKIALLFPKDYGVMTQVRGCSGQLCSQDL